jgi:hypothetical protein
MEYDPPLDPGIQEYVEALNAEGVETFESCEGGKGHAYPVPTIRFHGGIAEGFRAFAVVRRHNLPIATLRRVWVSIDDELTGPHWELTFDRGKSK